MIDTHTHLYSEEFDADFDQTIARAQAAGVDRFIFPATDKASLTQIMQAQAKYPQAISATIGLHPTSFTPETYKDELDFVEQNVDKYPFVAIGEIGIDCYWTTENLPLQRIVFERQLEIAAQHNLPIIIHARNAFDEIFNILDHRSELKTRGVFHAFSGTTADYEKIKSYGSFVFGIGGMITFKNSGVAAIVAQMSLDDIVLETDSPYITPAPNRGKRNESANIAIIAHKIAEIKNIDYEIVAATTTKNAEKLFNLHKA